MVALRLLPGDIGADALSRLRDEVRALAHVRHHGVLKVEDVVELSACYAAVIGWGEGLLLSELLAAGPLPPHAAVELARDLAWALHTAHTAQDPESRAPLELAHRELCPATVLVVRPADVKILDFGLSRIRRRGAVVEVDSLFVAPERRQGRDLPAADVYALAMILVVAALGRIPPIPDPADYAAAVTGWIQESGLRSPGLLRVLVAALALDPDQRPDAGTLARTLRDEAAYVPGPGLAAWVELAQAQVHVVAPVLRPDDVPDAGLQPPAPTPSDVLPMRSGVKPVSRPPLSLPILPDPPSPTPPRGDDIWDRIGQGQSGAGASRSAALLWAILAGGAAFVLVAGLLVGGWIASSTVADPAADPTVFSFTGAAGRLNVNGDPASEDWARRVRIVDTSGKAWSAGSVPAGSYTLDVTGIELPLTPVVVPEGHELRVLCSDPLRKCWVDRTSAQAAP